MRRAFLLLALLLALPVLPARAEMAESLRREFHPWSELGVVVLTDSNLSELERLLANPQTRVVAVQVDASRLSVPHAHRLMTWVREGRTVWFYDAHLAPFFGMRPHALKAEQFRGRPEQGQLGDRVLPGVATVALATGSHATLTGVGQATVWLPETEPGVYGAVAVEGDTVPLLQFRSDSPALAALRRDGRGLVVFKPLLWVKPLSGERFQMNLMEFSAGYPVPGAGGEGLVGDPPGPQAAWVEGEPAVRLEGGGERVVAAPMPAVLPATPAESSQAVPDRPSTPPAPQALYPDRIEVRGEGVLQGRVLTGELRFETTGESLRLPTQSVLWMTIGATTLDLDRLETRDGRRLAGLLLEDELKVELATGVRTVRKRQLSRLEIAPEVVPTPEKSGEPESGPTP